MAIRQRAGTVSLIGPRAVNEDALHLIDHSRESGRVSALLAVADGMGGLSAGDVASRTAIEVLTAPGPAQLAAEDLVSRIALADERISDLAADAGAMGTTLTSALVLDDQATVAHVGDSRAYIVHGGAISLITEDHSQVGRMVREGLLTDEQAMHHPNQNVLERALGAGEANPDIYRVGVGPGDILFLCTDGLHTFVTAEEICHELEHNASLQAACERLARLAEQRGSGDNITAVAWEYPSPPEPDAPAAPGVPPHRPETVIRDRALATAPVASRPEPALRSLALAGTFVLIYLIGFSVGFVLSVVT